MRRATTVMGLILTSKARWRKRIHYEINSHSKLDL